ncbi:hypothetical protein M0R45_013705 [Rubus argutus]|uniref:Uncharacterized protein n=1 Tax=Rubus argutus TaxID=59490 RepID=A0AAW1XLY0_RUBAR
MAANPASNPSATSSSAPNSAPLSNSIYLTTPSLPSRCRQSGSDQISHEALPSSPCSIQHLQTLKPQQPNAVVNLTSPLQVTDAALSKPTARARSDLAAALTEPRHLLRLITAPPRHTHRRLVPNHAAIVTAILCPSTGRPKRKRKEESTG